MNPAWSIYSSLYRVKKKSLKESARFVGNFLEIFLYSRDWCQSIVLSTGIMPPIEASDWCQSTGARHYDCSFSLYDFVLVRYVHRKVLGKKKTKQKLYCLRDKHWFQRILIILITFIFSTTNNFKLFNMGNFNNKVWY